MRLSHFLKLYIIWIWIMFSQSRTSEAGRSGRNLSSPLTFRETLLCVEFVSLPYTSLLVVCKKALLINSYKFNSLQLSDSLTTFFVSFVVPIHIGE